MKKNWNLSVPFVIVRTGQSFKTEKQCHVGQKSGIFIDIIWNKSTWVSQTRVCMLLLLQSIEDPADVLLDRVLASQVNAVNAGCLHEKTSDPIRAWKYLRKL